MATLQGTAEYTVTVAADGTATIRIKTPGIVMWLVSQVSTELPDAPAGAACFLRKNGYVVTPMIATGDVAGGDPPVLLQPADTLSIEWELCTPGTIGKALAFYDVQEYGR